MVCLALQMGHSTHGLAAAAAPEPRRLFGLKLFVALVIAVFINALIAVVLSVWPQVGSTRGCMSPAAAVYASSDTGHSILHPLQPGNYL